jgi:SulP family sulfate permease
LPNCRPPRIQAIARMVLQHVPAGERVYRIGEIGDAMYLIENGEIELTAENAVGVVEEIGRIGPESHFGELSLLTGQIRVEDATATRNSNLWILIKTSSMH